MVSGQHSIVLVIAAVLACLSGTTIGDTPASQPTTRPATLLEVARAELDSAREKESSERTAARLRRENNLELRSATSEVAKASADLSEATTFEARVDAGQRLLDAKTKARKLEAELQNDQMLAGAVAAVKTAESRVLLLEAIERQRTAAQAATANDVFDKVDAEARAVVEKDMIALLFSGIITKIGDARIEVDGGRWLDLTLEQKRDVLNVIGRYRYHFGEPRTYGVYSSSSGRLLANDSPGGATVY